MNFGARALCDLSGLNPPIYTDYVSGCLRRECPPLQSWFCAHPLSFFLMEIRFPLNPIGSLRLPKQCPVWHCLGCTWSC